MSAKPTEHIDQSFPDTERLFRRCHRDNMKPDGRATIFAFELPDLSVNRDRHSTAEEARKGFRPEDWGVVSISVKNLPPREQLPHGTRSYRFRPRHVPVVGNFSHSEVRVWRVDSVRDEDEPGFLVTIRAADDFDEDDPDRDSERRGLDFLEPDFHLRWRKRMEWACEAEVRPTTSDDS